MKRKIRLLCITSAVFIFSGAAAFGAPAGQWRQDGAGRWYQNDDSTYKKAEWMQDGDGSWYFFDSDGYVHTGWLRKDGSRYYFGEDGRLCTGQTASIDGEIYVIDGDGRCTLMKNYEGWVTDSQGRWYRYADGSYPKSEWKELEGKTCCFDENGYMRTGFYTENGATYWLGEDGALAKDTTIVIDGQEWKFGPDGAGEQVSHYKAPVQIPAESEKSDLEKQVDAMADQVLAGIVNDSMSQRQKAEAIYSWVRGHIRYVNHSEKGDWVKSAYDGFRTKRGDCYTYYSVSLALLTRVGIPCIEVVRTDGHHWWELVQIDGQWYHFDTTPRAAGGTFCLLTDAELAAYSNGVGKGSHNFDRSLYPPTP